MLLLSSEYLRHLLRWLGCYSRCWDIVRCVIVVVGHLSRLPPVFLLLFLPNPSSVPPATRRVVVGAASSKRTQSVLQLSLSHGSFFR